METIHAVPVDPPLLLTKLEAARLLGISRATLDRLAIRGVVRSLRPGGMRGVRFARAELERWVEAGCPRAYPSPRTKRRIVG